MAPPAVRDAWTARMIEDPVERQQELRRAGLIEATFSMGAVVFACLAVWGFTAGEARLAGIPAQSVGGLAVLCFAAAMAVAAGGGIRRRFIALLGELDARRP